MKRSAKLLAIGLLFAAAAFVFAKSEQPPGQPPFGLAVQGDAKGTKLSGALFVEFHHCDNTGECQARVVLRLRKANTNDFDTFYDDTTGIDPANPGVAQQEIIDLMAPQVIDRFFGNNNGNVTDDRTDLQIKLKSVSEFGELGVGQTDLTSDSQVVLTDLVIAVN